MHLESFPLIPGISQPSASNKLLQKKQTSATALNPTENVCPSWGPDHVSETQGFKRFELQVLNFGFSRLTQGGGVSGCCLMSIYLSVYLSIHLSTSTYLPV